MSECRTLHSVVPAHRHISSLCEDTSYHTKIRLYRSFFLTSVHYYGVSQNSLGKEWQACIVCLPGALGASEGIEGGVSPSQLQVWVYQC